MSTIIGIVLGMIIGNVVLVLWGNPITFMVDKWQARRAQKNCVHFFTRAWGEHHQECLHCHKKESLAELMDGYDSRS